MNELLPLLVQKYDVEKASGVALADLADSRRRIRDCAEGYRRRMRSRAGRLWLAQSIDDLLGEILNDEFLSEAARDEDVFASAEMFKARSLLDAMQGHRPKQLDGKWEDKIRQRERIVMGMVRGESPGQDEVGLVSRLPGPNEQVMPANEVQKRLVILEELEADLEEHGGGIVGGAPHATLGEVMGAVLEGEAIIHYWMPYDVFHLAGDLWALVLLKDRLLVCRCPLEHFGSPGFCGRIASGGVAPMDVSPLAEVVYTLRAAIRSGSDDQAGSLLSALSSLLLAPLQEAGIRPEDFKRWVIIPHGMLHAVPFAALPDPAGSTLLAERTAITMAASASVWLQQRKLENHAPETFLALANPSLDLPQAEREVQDISYTLAGLDGNVLMGPDATEEAYRRLSANRHLIHLATHGEFPEVDALDFQHLRLAPGDGWDGVIYAEEIRDMDLHHARLVCLSICNGGLYRFGPGDEPYGLMPAFQTAGARNVVGSLWPIEDVIGRHFMTRMYKDVLEEGPAEACRRACLQLRSDGASISQWASFVCVGPGEPFESH